VKITMAHGSGGNATRKLIKELFQKYLSNAYLDKMEDASSLPPTEYPLALTTDSFVITPLEFPGGDIGKLAICGTVNDLWMIGAQPVYLTAGFILEEGLDLYLLEKIISSLSLAAKEAGVMIVAGDTKVIQGNGGMYINTTGLGYQKHYDLLSNNPIKAGDSIIVSGNLGDHHACIMSQRMGIENNIKSDCANLGSIVKQLLECKIAVRSMRDITRGGLGTVLNEIAEASSVAIEIEESSIPINPEVKALCEILGLDPLYMANEGKFLCIIPQEDEEKALSIFKSNPIGENATVIGKVISSNYNLVTLKTRLGGKRIVDILYGEGLPRIC
jgi:hydrogenase expression/formation protein HypE